jgi:glutamate N-acetyltransferase / amino-acid N-acetyltransferase
VYEDGIPCSFDANAVSSSLKNERNVQLRLRLKSGGESVRFWTCDLTAEYIRLNADYTT